eukprot:jgi/Picsp_1/2370/NSC_05833-R1_hypothetical protein M23134_02055 [Microscilla marina ATCC 23134]
MQLVYSTVLLLLGVVASATAQKQITFSPPIALPSPPPPPATPSPSSGPPPTPFNTPGLVFSLIVPGYTAQNFGAAQRQAICDGVLADSGLSNSKEECRLGSLSTFNATSVLVNGYSWYTWTATPSVTDLNVVTAVRNEQVVQLTKNTSALFPSLKGTYPNCACLGTSQVTASSTTPFDFAVNLTGIPGPVQCGARLIYNPADPVGIINVVGVDDGSVTNGNLGKFCSTPPVEGGVSGTPGSGSCRQYGVVASSSGTTQATCTNPPTPTTGAIDTTNVCSAAGGTTPTDKGKGYTSVPAVTVSAPNPLAAEAVATLSGAAPVFTVTNSGSNGPYNGKPSVTLGGGTCVSATCTGTVLEIIDALGNTAKDPTCLASDVVVTMDKATAGAKVTGTSLPAGTRCTSPPTVAFSSALLQPSVTAQIVAVIDAGLVQSLIVTNAGSGYRSAPTVTIAAPAGSTDLGKLCGPSPIAGLGSSISYTTPTPITTSGMCQPLGRDTFANKVCSIPAAVNGGIYEALGVGTCNAVSAFRVEPTATTTSTCGVLGQTFVTTVAPSPASPPATPPASPPATPPASPPATPPSPTPLVCRYDGIYELRPLYSPCNGYYIASGTDSDCSNNFVNLRRFNQLGGKPARKNWRLATVATGSLGTPTTVEAVARARCTTSKYLAAPNLQNSGYQLKVGGNAWEWQVVPYPGSKSCEEVNLISQNNLDSRAFLEVPRTCTRFLYNATDGGRQRFRIKKV